MAHVKKTLNLTTYVSIASADEVVNVQLPIPPFRSGSADKVELILATSDPGTQTAGIPNELATILENTRYQPPILTQLTVPTGETLYARWIGNADNTETADRFVVVF